MRSRITRFKKKPMKKSVGKHRTIRKKVRKKNAYDIGFDKGYNSGFNDASQLGAKDLQKDYDDGFNKGMYAGGDAYVDELLPHDVILPDQSIREIISVGLDQLKPKFHRLILSREIADQIKLALLHKKSFSIVRIGDGELLTLAQDLVLDSNEVKRRGPFLNYAGVNIPDLMTRDQLAESIRKASVVGIPKLRIENFLPLMFPVFHVHAIDYKQLNLTYSTINYVLYTDGLLAEILRGQRILVIGNQAMGLAGLLQSHGMQVVEPIDQVQGVQDINRVLSETANREFDIALVSAGISAVIITERIATELGKVALDFGHLTNSLISGEAPWKE